MRTLVLLMLMGFGVQAFAERIGQSSSASGQWAVPFDDVTELEPTVTTRQAEALPNPPRPPRDIRPPVAQTPPQPAPQPAPPPAQVAGAPEKTYFPTINKDPSKCSEPVQHPEARNTPLKVYVDQESQTIRVCSPERPCQTNPDGSISGGVTGPVSTGGGLKIPNGEIQKSPYCARTPKAERKIVSAVRPSDFDGTGCNDGQVRQLATVFGNKNIRKTGRMQNDDIYLTATFTDKENHPIPMPDAVRIWEKAGIFFHEVPPSYANRLGHAVSGECIRLPKSSVVTRDGQKVEQASASYLKKLILRYGAMEVNMGPPPQNVPRYLVNQQGQRFVNPSYCDEQMVAEAKYGVQSGQIAGNQRTGSEDVVGGGNIFEQFFGGLGRIFGVNPQPQPQYRQQPYQYRSRG